MQDSPRLQITDPNAATTYAPLSWLAVASAALGVLFILALLFLSYSAYVRKQPLMETWLLAIAAISVVLAFVSRRQILASEGTLVGIKYSDFGWWIGVFGCLGYAAYLTAIEFSFRREVDSAFRQNWSKPLQNINVDDSKDPALYSAAFMTLPIGARSDLNRNDIAGMDRRFQGQISKFRGTDLIKLAARNPNNITFTDETIRDWSMKGTNIECTLGVVAKTPEGDFQVVIPMAGLADDKKLRQWMMMTPDGGYIKGRKLTLYGWWIDYLQVSGQEIATRFLSTLGQPMGQPLAYTGFIKLNANPNQAEQLHRDILKTAGLRAIVGGNIAGVFSFTNQDTLFPMPAGWQEDLVQNIFGKPNGLRLTPAELETFKLSWNRPRSIVQGGTYLKTLNDGQSTLLINDRVLQLRVPIDILRGEDANRPTASKGVIILEPQPEELKKIRVELENARKSGNEFIASPPQDLKIRETHWRVIRIESDLNLLQPPAPQGGPGGMEGMMG